MYQKIRDLHEDSDLSQARIASLLNVTQATYSRYENGTLQIPLESLIKLALFYDTSTEYLLNLTANKTPYSRNNNSMTILYLIKQHLSLTHKLML